MVCESSEAVGAGVGGGSSGSKMPTLEEYGIILLFSDDECKQRGIAILSEMKKSRVLRRKLKDYRKNLNHMLCMTIWIIRSLIRSDTETAKSGLASILCSIKKERSSIPYQECPSLQQSFPCKMWTSINFLSIKEENRFLSEEVQRVLTSRTQIGEAWTINSNLPCMDGKKWLIFPAKSEAQADIHLHNLTSRLTQISEHLALSTSNRLGAPLDLI
ncbi:unnamed protein product [Fraxinus pennsylvanica]|uniref:Uncharacterized protein n=1 Tax=Fraxinus pennsylvanica TaxID=56036 RepID=A0AAD2E3N1_9LAMI|nr:unnamed protein product [Fraxinus pennsylvanica]